jgi:hypothetical protein
VKAEFGRILEERKAVNSVSEKFSDIEDKVLEWAARSNSRNVKLQMAEMESMLLEEPTKKAGIERNTWYVSICMLTCVY